MKEAEAKELASKMVNGLPDDIVKQFLDLPERDRDRVIDFMRSDNDKATAQAAS